MSDDREQERQRLEMRARKEADLVQNRIGELRQTPIRGSFDVAHLKALHAYIFQDFPEYRPGIVRDDAPGWEKRRGLEGVQGRYSVHYLAAGVEQHIAGALDRFGGPKALKDSSLDEAAQKLARLYGDLDHGHPFYEGNSRTLREFTRELSAEAGLKLDWPRTNVGPKERNALYLARDLAVHDREFPGLTEESAAQSKDRRAYEASLNADMLRRHVGQRTLATIIKDGLSRPPRDLTQWQGATERAADPRPVQGAVAAPAERPADSRADPDYGQAKSALLQAPRDPPPDRAASRGRYALALQESADPLEADMADLEPTQQPKKARTSRAFDDVSLSDDTKFEKEVMPRFKTPAGQEEARDIWAIYKDDLEQIKEKYQKRTDDFKSHPRHDWTKPWSPEYAGVYNQQLVDFAKQQQQEEDRKRQLCKAALVLEEFNQYGLTKVVPANREDGKGDQKLITWQPSEELRAELDQTGDKERADRQKHEASIEFDRAASPFQLTRNTTGVSRGDLVRQDEGGRSM